MKIFKAVFLLLVVSHLFLSGKIINKWFTRHVVTTARRTTGIPEKDIFITLNKTQASFITWARTSVPEDSHFVWHSEIDPMVNYYVYPRRAYSDKDYDPARSAEFYRDHGIGFMVEDFASMTVVPVDSP